jgi:DNA-binding NarL/FixJ family response regulator
VSEELLQLLGIEVTKTSLFVGKDLSPQEMEVLRYICMGCLTKQIASKMKLSPRTIDKYREHIFLKTGTKSIATLIIHAIKKGWVKV